MKAKATPGMIKIGEWGYGDTRGSGAIWCRPEDREAVQAAYNAIEEGDLGPDVLDDVCDAGGFFVRDEEAR